MKKSGIYMTALAVFLLGAIIPNALAVTASSSSYALDFDSINNSTSKGSSSSYGVHGTVGDNLPGTSSSSNYQLCTGYISEAYGCGTATPTPPPTPTPTPPPNLVSYGGGSAGMAGVSPWPSQNQTNNPPEQPLYPAAPEQAPPSPPAPSSVTQPSVLPTSSVTNVPASFTLPTPLEFGPQIIPQKIFLLIVSPRRSLRYCPGGFNQPAELFYSNNYPFLVVPTLQNIHFEIAFLFFLIRLFFFLVWILIWLIILCLILALTLLAATIYYSRKKPPVRKFLFWNIPGKKK